MPSIVFAHGLEGSPNGRKIQMLRSAGFSVEAPDGRGKPLQARIADLEELTKGRRVLLVGSSYGGLAAAYLAHHFPERFVGLLLLAPALHRSEPPVHDSTLLHPPAQVPTLVIHGVRDAIVPIDASRRYALNGGIRLIERDDDHRLQLSMEVMIEAVQKLIQISDTTLDDI